MFYCKVWCDVTFAPNVANVLTVLLLSYQPLFSLCLHVHHCWTHTHDWLERTEACRMQAVPCCAESLMHTRIHIQTNTYWAPYTLPGLAHFFSFCLMQVQIILTNTQTHTSFMDNHYQTSRKCNELWSLLYSTHFLKDSLTLYKCVCLSVVNVLKWFNE